MALKGLFASPPSGSSDYSGTKNKPKGIFSSPPPAIDETSYDHQLATVQAQNDAQVSAASAKYANSFTGTIKTAASAAVEPFVQGYKDAAAQVKPKSWNPIEIAKNGAKAVEDAFSASLDDTGEKLYNAAHAIGTHPLSTEAFAAGGEAVIGAVNTLFAAATAPLTYATAIPGIGHVADKVNELFAALGSGAGAHVASAVVDDNPFLSQKTKDTIRPLVHDSAALIAQLAAGKAGGEGFSALGAKTKGILNAVSEDVKTNPPSANPAFQATPLDGTLTERLDATAPRPLPVFGDTSLRPLPIIDENVPGVQEVPNSARYTPPSELPTINMGRTPSVDLPTIKTDVPGKGQIPGLTYDPITDVPVEAKPVVPVKPGSVVPDFSLPPEKQAPMPTVSRETAPAPAPEAAPAPVAASEAAPAPIQLPEVQRAVSEDRGIPKLSSNVESKAIAQNLATDFGDLPQYDKVNWEDQAAKATQLLAEDPARAHRIALGTELPPDGLLHGAVFDAVERKAFKNGDVHTIMRLSRDSTLGAKASRYGQEIAVLGMRDTGSPVKAIEAVKKARDAAFEKKTGKKADAAKNTTVKEIKAEIRETAAKSRPTWEQFMSELTCNT